ncbi:high affinity nitrate transporter 2.7 [Rhodamnia argentea]|uniref:High affinity nitrate transporter 2.7 n=1 Tax=Rhodamnia argentea TaxID=178133 RepID=A0A8B8P8B3_9MYRT|nr:high affinity nitrate transporter 2.7 [Rhodamnia argentea]
MEAHGHRPMKRPEPSHSGQLPVDPSGRATAFRPFSAPTSPHMRAFHLAWLSLFSCFFATFSIPPLLPVIRHDLRLTPSDVGAAGVASFAGAILSRLAMGPACDLVGPRVASAVLSLLTAPAVLAAALVTTPAGFIAVRFFVGFSLANFVANQFWMSSMFAAEVVGLANGVAAGWANVGSGLTQLVMPLIYASLMKDLRLSSSLAWRLSFIVPAIFQIATAIMVLAFGQDLPNGNYKRNNDYRKKKNQNNGNIKSSEEGLFDVLMHGLRNYRGWILGLTYGYCFGVELTTDNILAQYFYDRFGVRLEVAGLIAACFGAANCVTRPAGGVASDILGRRFGMRGRLWGLWGVQTAAGLLCVWLGRVGSLWGSIAVMCCFGALVQAAAGLTFGVVPFVSKRSLGVISGMTGSGGTVGAVVTQLLLFSGSGMSRQTSISLMGLLMLVCTLPVALIYFPRWGGMFCGPSDDLDADEDDYWLLD